MKAEKKVTLITGSSRGLGAHAAYSFAAQGHAVVINYSKSEAEAAKLKQKIELDIPNAKVLACPADVSKRDEAKAMFDSIYSHFGNCEWTYHQYRSDNRHQGEEKRGELLQRARRSAQPHPLFGIGTFSKNNGQYGYSRIYRDRRSDDYIFSAYKGKLSKASGRYPGRKVRNTAGFFYSNGLFT